MDKPAQLIVNDLQKSLTQMINDTQLPMFIVTPVIDKIYNQCVIIEKQQLELVTEQYKQSQNEENTKGTD